MPLAVYGLLIVLLIESSLLAPIIPEYWHLLTFLDCKWRIDSW